jgi:hypothetical protein
MKRVAERCLACRSDAEPGAVFCRTCRKGVVREGPAYTRCIVCRRRMPALSVVCFHCGTRAGHLGGQPGHAHGLVVDHLHRTFLLGVCGGGALVLSAALFYARLI